MENSLSRNYSSLRFENEPHQGCMWGIFHMLHFHHRHNVKKKHQSKRHGGRRRAGGIKYSRLKEGDPDTSDREVFINAEVDNLQFEENMHQLPSFPSRYQRTHSIHHLEPSHHHLPDEVREDAEESAEIDLHQVACSPHTRTSDSVLPKLSEEPVSACKQCELYDNLTSVKSLGYNQLNELGRQLLDEALRHDKFGKSKEALSKQKCFDLKGLDRDTALYQSKEFVESLEILNVNKSFLKILEDPNYSLAHHVQALQASNAKRGLTKSESFPVGDSSRRMHIEPSKLKENGFSAKQGGKSQSRNPSLLTRVKSYEDIRPQNMHLMVDDNAFSSPEARATGTSSFPGSFEELKKQVVINRFKNIKQKIKHAIKESQKGRRISMDGILHKIPYGRSFSKNAKREVTDRLKESMADNEGKDSPRARYVNDVSVSALGKGGQRHIRRARSLNESLDKYSQLFKSSFGHDEKWRPTEKFKLTNEDGGLLFSRAPKSLGRIRSLPNLESHCFHQNEASVNALSSDTPTSAPLDSGTSMESISFSEQKSVGLLIRTENVAQFDVLVKSESSTFNKVLMESELENNGHENAEASDSTEDTSNVENGESSPSTQYEQEPGSTNRGSTMLAQPSPISVLEPCFQEDVISPAKFSISGRELEPRRIDFEELVDEVNQQDQSIIDSLSESGSTYDLEKIKSASMHLASDFLHVLVDRKDEADFNYVRDVLELSRFSGNEHLGTWHSPDQPVNPSLFEEVETCSPPKSGDPEDDRSRSHDHQILFDIINEVLLEIYDRSFSYWPRTLSCNCHIRPMPKGYHVLEEVWSCIRWYLSSQPELEPSMDYIVARDISKDDGWMNLQFDSECVGLELEEMIWDDLLEEVIYS